MNQTSANSCGNCERMRQEVQRLRQQLHEQGQAMAQLAEEIRQLKEKLAAKGKDSSTSSKPPSSDIVKPGKDPATLGDTPRKGGGQPGHPRHSRPAFSPAELTAGSHTHRMSHCPDCHSPVVPANQLPRIVQQIEITQPPLEISEHCALPYWCPHCCRVHYAALPGDVELGGLLGPRLTAFIAYLKGFCHASYSTIRVYLRAVLRVKASRGMLNKVIARSVLPWTSPTSRSSCVCQGRPPSTSMKPGTRTTATAGGPGAFVPVCTRCSRSIPGAPATSWSRCWA